jgi:hypothetical protein
MEGDNFVGAYDDYNVCLTLQTQVRGFVHKSLAFTHMNLAHASL